MGSQIAPAPAGYACEVNLLSENFESGIPADWVVVTEDYTGPLQNYAAGLEGWFVQSGPTSTSNTGPTSAFEGNFYLYCEGSGPVNKAEKVTLTSPVIDLALSKIYSLSFYLNMYGPSTSLLVNVIEGGVKTQVLNPIVGNSQGLDVWEQIYVDLTAYQRKSIQLQFEAIKPQPGNDGDIAIDNVKICASIATIPTLSEWGLISLMLILLIVSAKSILQVKDVALLRDYHSK